MFMYMYDCFIFVLPTVPVSGLLCSLPGFTFVMFVLINVFLLHLDPIISEVAALQIYVLLL